MAQHVQAACKSAPAVWCRGLPTIRAYDAGARFYEAFLGALDANGAWWFCFINTSRWIGFRLDTIAAIMLTAGALLAMAIHTKVGSCCAQAPDIWLSARQLSEADLWVFPCSLVLQAY